MAFVQTHAWKIKYPHDRCTQPSAGLFPSVELAAADAAGLYLLLILLTFCLALALAAAAAALGG
jgi:hypothetical protein